MSITYYIFHCFDEAMETRTIYLDILKAFDKAWHKRLIYKLRQYDFTATVITDFVSNRKQRVILKCQHSSWVDIKAGAPQGSRLHKWFKGKLTFESKIFRGWNFFSFDHNWWSAFKLSFKRRFE